MKQYINQEKPKINLNHTPLITEEEYLETIFEGELNPLFLGRSIRMVDCTFQKAIVNSAKLLKLSLMDIEITDSSFVSTNFSECSFDQVSITKCRLTGTIFSDGRLEDCTITDSATNLTTFRFAKLKNVHFINCNLSNADFMGATLKKVNFENCNLEGANFSNAKFDQVDLRGSDLTGISGISNLNGAIISTSQLMLISYALADSVGIKVIDN